MKNSMFMHLMAVVVLLNTTITLSAKETESVEAKEVLARQFSETFAPRDVLIKMYSEAVPPEYHDSIKNAMEKHLNYSVFQELMAQKYAALFSMAELKEIAAFHKTPAAPVLYQKIGQKIESDRFKKILQSPPKDTLATRQEEALRLAKIITSKPYMIGMIENTPFLTKEQRKDRAHVLSEKLYGSDTKLLDAIQQSKANELVPWLTTEQLKEATVFYATETGKKLYVKAGFLAMAFPESMASEFVRIAKEHPKSLPEELRKKILDFPAK